MRNISEINQLEFAAYLHDFLRTNGINVVLSGGSVVTLFSHNLYVSKDLDLINIAFKKRKKCLKMKSIGFEEIGRHFSHSQSAHIVKFPESPLSVGEVAVKEI